MFCTQCGANNADSAIICVQCGRNLGTGPPLSAPSTTLSQMPGASVPNYLVFAIIVTVLCCLPAGIPAIIYAAQVNGKLQAGDIAGAQSASKNAKMWCWIALGAGVAVCVFYGLLIGAKVMSHMHR